MFQVIRVVIVATLVLLTCSFPTDAQPMSDGRLAGNGAEQSSAGTSACCHPDGICTEEVPGVCTGQEHTGLSCAVVICNIVDDGIWDNGPGDPLGAAPVSQLDLTTPGGFFAEAADNFIFKSASGTGLGSCPVKQIKYWGMHLDFTAFACAGTGVVCDPLDPAACGGVPADCDNGGLDLCEDGLCSLSSMPCRVGGFACPSGGGDVCVANPSCTKTPDDYQSIRVTIYNDTGVGALNKSSPKIDNGQPIATGPSGMPFTPFNPEPCAIDQDCIDSGCPTGTTCTGDGGTTCELGGSLCGTFGDPDGSHTGSIKYELIVIGWSWVPYQQPIGTVVADAYEITMEFDGYSTTILQDQKNWLAITPELAFGSGWYQTAWMRSQNFDGDSAQRMFEVQGVFPWTPLDPPADLAFEFIGSCPYGDPCEAFGGAIGCADVVPPFGVTDDVCTWWECAGTCVSTSLLHPSDMGGTFGDCLPDGFCNLADALHALTCFSGTNTCESINIDAGGMFGACAPDGICNLADALHALTCFSGDNVCDCAPTPEISPDPIVVGAVSLTAVADRSDAVAGGELTVRLFMEPVSRTVGRVSPAVPLRAYQLDVGVTGGRVGYLELDNIEIENRANSVFGADADLFDAYNLQTGQMLAGLYDGFVETTGRMYLATFTYHVSPDAVGTFVIDIRSDDQTLLVGAEQTDKIEVARTVPAVVTVVSESTRTVK